MIFVVYLLPMCSYGEYDSGLMFRIVLQLERCCEVDTLIYSISTAAGLRGCAVRISPRATHRCADAQLAKVGVMVAQIDCRHILQLYARVNGCYSNVSQIPGGGSNIFECMR